ncbi:MAG: hypothetical protein Q8S13_11410 [Dehalococcoidia bacterium]|nr:hypothetical protein [Dehalococcoidia bacterium]
MKRSFPMSPRRGTGHMDWRAGQGAPETVFRPRSAVLRDALDEVFAGLPAERDRLEAFLTANPDVAALLFDALGRAIEAQAEYLARRMTDA